nr:LysE family transporter [Rhodococcus sp. (in: high G+C Gram-positive bacteria)]
MVAYLVPGPDWLMVIRGATDGRRNGAITGLGTQAGLLVHGLLATVGISALIAAAPQVLVVIQVVGALYLLYIAVSGLRSGLSSGTNTSVGWRQAFVTNLTNPKVIIFFAAVAPQFITSGSPVWQQMLVLTVIDVLLGIAWWTLLAFVLSPIVMRIGTDRINVVASIALAIVAIGLLIYTAVEYV